MYCAREVERMEPALGFVSVNKGKNDSHCIAESLGK